MTEDKTKQVAAAAGRIRANIEKVIVGKGAVIELVLTALLSEGHILLEDVPGIGKTMLAKSVACSLKCQFLRIQCTPDLLPSDITGTHIYNQKSGDFEFHPGPVFAQVVLADEINRATPRSQSALLEAMEERQVTLDGETRPLPRPFIVLATQNPVELEGTFPLPEAQLDRFLMKIKIGYTSEADDSIILDRFMESNPADDLSPVINSEDVLKLQQECRHISISPEVRQYIIRLIRATRGQPSIQLGASPRAMLGLMKAAQALAAIRGRDFVIPDDVKYLAPYVIAHRIMLEPSLYLKGRSGDDVLHEILESVPVPVEETVNR
jgi:MoxR-like ATPase